MQAEGPTDGFEVSAKIVTLERGYVAQGLASAGHLAHVVGLFILPERLERGRQPGRSHTHATPGMLACSQAKSLKLRRDVALVVMVWGDLGHDAPSRR